MKQNYNYCTHYLGEDNKSSKNIGKRDRHSVITGLALLPCVEMVIFDHLILNDALLSMQRRSAKAPPLPLSTALPTLCQGFAPPFDVNQANTVEDDNSTGAHPFLGGGRWGLKTSQELRADHSN